jgi:hypothetical protein
MIYQAVKLICEQLNQYFIDEIGEDDTYVKPGNIALIDAKTEGNGPPGNTNGQEEGILATLVNMQEEKVLKNLPAYAIRDSEKVVYENPPIILNLYLLFSAVNGNYDKALVYLANVIAFFQGKRSFTNLNTPIRSDLSPPVRDMEQFKIIMDLYSPSFEEANYLWGTLGGKQYPYALYRMRVTPVRRTQKKEIRGVIKEIKIED